MRLDLQPQPAIDHANAAQTRPAKQPLVALVELKADAFDDDMCREPTVIVAETIKGKGVDFMERSLAWHAGSLGAADLERALKALEATREKESV